MYSESTFYSQTPIGNLKLEFQDKKLFSLSIIDKKFIPQNKKCINKNTLSLLNRYFVSAIPFPKVSLIAQGTDFQQRVWYELSQIHLGETRTYGDIANKLNSSPRAVGNACRKNPIQIIIPCHRVVSAKGIGGYAGETEGKQLKIKRWLLSHEGVEL